MRSRAAKFLLLVTAMLSLSLSAVSACACTHHRDARKADGETPSCHSASHETSNAESVTSDSGLPTFDETCNCFLRQAESAITAKSEIKRSKAETSPSIGHGQTVEFNAAENVTLTDDQIASAVPNFHTKALLRSGPSRAPPRL